MAYAELRGDYWRGRYKNPPGVRPLWGTVSEDLDGYPFTSKQKALDAANDKEAENRTLVGEWRKLTKGRTPPNTEGVTLEEWMRLLEGLRRRANGGRDPDAGEITLADWLRTKWWPAQDLSRRTVDRYHQYLNNQVLPAFGGRAVNTLDDPQEIATWELGLRARYSGSTAGGARTLLSTILSDAKDAGLIDENVAQRSRGRGRKRGRASRGHSKTSTKVWASPFEVLLVAERCALMSGADSDLVKVVTKAWTGMRWAELIGLLQEDFRLSRLYVESQLGEEDSGAFVREGPKDDSIRNDQAGLFSAIVLPPFLSVMLSEHLVRHPPRRCRCRRGSCGGGLYLFLGPNGGHPRRANYARRIWHPAVDGAYLAEDGNRPRPAQPVLVDVASGIPGVPVRPAWPYASGEDWAPPRGRGLTHLDEPVVDAQAVDCPSCDALAGHECTSRTGNTTDTHRPRRDEAARRGHVRARALASWVPLKPGLTPHGLRHSHKVWMDEDGISEICKHDRLGHTMPGIGGTYSHVSPAMRESLKGALQARWEKALAQRAGLSPTSPVPLLHELLAPHRRKTYQAFVSQTSPDHAREPVLFRVDGASDLGGA